MNTAASETISRYEKRKIETRTKLLGAARRVLGEKGIDATTIRDITDAADLGFGSFYNYFSSKEDLLDAVIASIGAEFGSLIEDQIVSIGDPVEKMAAGIGNMIGLIRHDAVTCQFLVRMGSVESTIAEAALGLMESDLRRGMESGQFSVPDIATARELVFSCLMGFMRGRLSGRLDSTDDAHGVHMILRLLGADDREAERLGREYARILPAPTP